MLAVVDPTAVVEAAIGFLNLLNLRLNLLDYNGCAKGDPLQPVVHPLLSLQMLCFMTNALERLIWRYQRVQRVISHAKQLVYNKVRILPTMASVVTTMVPLLGAMVPLLNVMVLLVGATGDE